MAAQSDAIVDRHTLLNRLVLDRRTTDEIGRVDRLWMDPQTHRVIAVGCKTGWLGRDRRCFSWQQIETVGGDSILVNFSDVPEYELPSTAEVAIGNELWTDAGNAAGRIADYRIEIKTGQIVEYLFAARGLRGIAEGIFQLKASAVESMGRKRAIAKDDAVQNAPQYAEGLGQKLDRAAEFFKEDYTKTSDNWQAFGQGAQKFAQQFKKTAQQAGDRAKEQFESAKERIQNTDENKDKNS